MQTPPTLARLLDKQHGLVRRDQVLAAGLSVHALTYRLRSGGPWQRVVGTVYATWTGPVIDEQRRRAALLYAGPGALLGGLTALQCLGMRYLPADDRVHVVVPQHKQPASRGFVVVHRTWRRLRPPRRRDGLQLTPSAHAVGLASRHLVVLQDVRALVSEAVARHVVTVPALRAELAVMGRRNTALLRQAVDDAGAGARSAPEAELLAAVRTTRLPEPEVNARVYDDDGELLAVPDLLWRDVLLVVEVDSREFHLLTPGSAEATMRRHARLTAAGYVMLHYSPERIRRELGAVLAEIERTYSRLAATTR